MKSNHPQSWQFAFWALVACALFAVLVFKTGLHRSDRMGVEAVKVRQIELQSERTPILSTVKPSANKPAVRWGELTETKATNSPICK